MLLNNQGLFSKAVRQAMMLFVLLLVSASSALASHYRYGVVTATRLSETSTTVTYRLNVSEAWRLGSASTFSSFSISGGNTGSVGVTMTVVTDPSGGWSNGTGTTTVTLNKSTTPTRITYTSCCKISTIVNNHDLSWDEHIILYTAASGSSPVSTMPAIINMPVNAPAATYTIPATDPDAGSTITFGTPAFTGNLAGQSEPSGFSINSTTGQITLNTVGKTIGQQYNALVTVTDNDGNRIMLDFLINMVGASTPPVFDYTVTPTNGAIYNVLAGQNISFPIKATDGDANSTVSMSVSGLPAYITTGNFSSAALPALGNPSQTTFSWTPSGAQIGTTNVLNFVATDNVGVQTTTSVTIRVVAEPAPVFVAPTAAQNSIRQIETGVLFNDVVTAQSSLNSNVSIAFATGIPSNASLSPAVPTAGANPGTTTLSWTPTPAQFGVHNFNYQATIAAFPTIFTTRNFQIIVNTTPSFTSTPVENVVAGQLYSYNVTVSDANIPYGDTVDIIGASIPSWLTLVSTGNGTAVLSGTPTLADVGTYEIALEAEDIYHHGTTAHVHQHFDLTVASPATATAAGATTFCAGSSVLLTANTGTNLTYQWRKDGVNLAGETNITFTATTSGTYTVAVTSNGTTSISNAVLVTVNGLTTITNCPQTQYQQVYADVNNCSTVFTYEPAITNATSTTYTFTGATTASGNGTGSGSAFNVGQTTVTITANGICNNATCSFVVTVIDNKAPNAITKNVTVYLNAAGTATVTAQDVNDGSNDNCGNVSLSLVQTGTICGTATENQYVNLVAPAGATITAVNFASYGNPTGTCGNYNLGWCHAANSKSIVESYALNNQTASIPASNGLFGDPCFGTVKRLNVQATWTGTSTTNTFNCSKVGNNTVTLVVTDANGNVSTAYATVTVIDTITPNAIAQNVTVNLNANGVASVTADQVNNGSTDNCSIASLALSKTSFNHTNLGLNTVTLTVTDASGNISTATATVNVIDNIVPVITCANNLTVNTSSATVIANYPFATNLTDASGNFGAATLINGASAPIAGSGVCQNGTYYPSGQSVWTPQINTLNVANFEVSADFNANAFISSNSSSPIIVGGNSWRWIGIVVSPTGKLGVLYNNNNTSFSTVSAPINTWSNVKLAVSNGVSSLYLNGTLIHTANTGTLVTGNNLNFTTTNYSNGTSLNGCLRNLTIANGSDICGAKVNFNAPSVVENTPGYVITQTAGLASGATFPVGVTTQSFSVADLAGNTATCSYTVTVVDAKAPKAVAQNVTINLDATGAASTTAAAVNNGSSDACGIASIVLSKTSFDCTNVGNNNVTLTVTDVNGNVSTANAVVTVVDAIAPVAVAQNVTINLDATGAASTTAAAVNNGSSDACGIASIVLSKTSFDCTNVGNNNVTLTVTDVNGNVSTANAVVTVVDAIAPVAVAQNVTINLDANGAASTTAAAVNNGSTDACGIASLVLSKTSFNCSNVGNNNVTLTVTDVNGNVSTANAVVTVVDNIAPTAVAQNVTVTLVNGAASVTAAQVNNGSADNCGIASLVVSPNTFNCTTLGANTVTLTVTDVNGNVSSTTATVNVIGAIPTVSIAQSNQPGFTQGGAIVLTASSPTAISYAWSGGPSTAVNYVYATGTYVVTATNIYGCTVTGNTLVNYTANNLLSSYVIIGREEVKLEDHVVVNNGGVGVTSSCGEVEVEDYSTVSAAGTFVRAKYIEVKQNSVVTNKTFTAVPFAILPPFLANPYCNSNNNNRCSHSHHNSCNNHNGCNSNNNSNNCYHSHHNGSSCANNNAVNTPNNNKNVNQNVTVTITDSIMGQVVIGKNATVTFTSPRLYMKGLEVGEGAIVNFTQCAVIRVCNHVQFKKNVQFNKVNSTIVTIYVDDKFDVSEGSQVEANVYSRDEIKIDGKQGSVTNMKGMYIGEEVEAKDYVNFYWNTNTVCANNNYKSEFIADESGLNTDYFDVNVYPNPAVAVFNVRLLSSSTLPFTVEVFDMSGKLIETRNVNSSTMNEEMGANFAEGMYLIKVTQGENTKTMRLVRTNK